MKSLLRVAAIAVASTALVVGGTTAATAGPGDAVTGVALQPTVIRSSSVFVPGTITATGINGSLTATVNVNGVAVANGVSIFQNGYTHQRAWGAGVVSLTNFADPNGLVQGVANGFAVRYGVKSTDGASIRKVGKKLTFKIKLRYVDNRNASVGIRKAKLQVKRGGSWKTLKNVKLNRKGKATYKRTDGKKRSYRLVIKETGLYEGAVLRTNRKL